MFGMWVRLAVMSSPRRVLLMLWLLGQPIRDPKDSKIAGAGRGGAISRASKAGSAKTGAMRHCRAARHLWGTKGLARQAASKYCRGLISATQGLVTGSRTRTPFLARMGCLTAEPRRDRSLATGNMERTPWDRT